MTPNLRFLVHVIQVHSKAEKLQFVAEMAEILQALREVTLLLGWKGVCAGNCKEVLPVCEGIFERL